MQCMLKSCAFVSHILSEPSGWSSGCRLPPYQLQSRLPSSPHLPFPPQAVSEENPRIRLPSSSCSLAKRKDSPLLDLVSSSGISQRSSQFLGPGGRFTSVFFFLWIIFAKFTWLGSWSVLIPPVKISLGFPSADLLTAFLVVSLTKLPRISLSWLWLPAVLTTIFFSSSKCLGEELLPHHVLNKDLIFYNF